MATLAEASGNAAEGRSAQALELDATKEEECNNNPDLSLPKGIMEHFDSPFGLGNTEKVIVDGGIEYASLLHLPLISILANAV
ncbi:hypothetical protein SLS58_007099 [Diplodia intermedia]|uniref:Uncharacterized protein n=1 Tax=Diplodia intermedia TaxID=856260 RepID=A0ABR3TLP0_9PEZI